MLSRRSRYPSHTPRRNSMAERGAIPLRIILCENTLVHNIMDARSGWRVVPRHALVLVKERRI